MTEQIKQEWTSDITKLQKAYAAIEKMNSKLLAQNRKLAQQSRRASNQARSGAMAAGKAIISLAASYMSVSTAIQVVTQSLKDKEEQERKSKNFAITVADAQIKALRNLGVVSSEVRKQFTQDIEKLSAETKVGLQPLYLAASTALSSSGGDVQATMRALRAAARIAPESPEEMTAISGALLHMGKATRTQDAMKNLGLLAAVGQQAAITDWDKIARNLSKGMIGVTATGGTAREAGAIVAAITQAMPDPQGRMAAQASIKLAVQLQEFLPEEDRYTWEKGKGGRMKRVLARPGTGLAGPMERIRFLQAPENRDLLEQFAAQASFEAKAEASVYQMLKAPWTKGDMAAQYMERGLAVMPKADDAKQVATELVKGIRQPFAQRVAESERGHRTRIEQIQGSRTGMQRAVEATYSRERMLETLEAGGMNWLDRQATTVGWWAIPGLRQEQYETNIRDRARRLRAGGDTALADTLERHLKEQTAELKRITRAMEARDRQPQPAGVGGNLNQHGE